MTSSWAIDDAVAIETIEARFRALNRRLFDLESAIAASQEMLKAEPENFAFRLSARSLLSMHESLQAEKIELTRYRVFENVSLILDGRGIHHHSASALSLSIVLNRIQRLFSSVAQSITSGPTMRGPLSALVTEMTGLRVAATYPSSFGLSLYVPSHYDLHGNSVSSASLEALFQLFGSVETEDSLINVTGEIGTRSIRHLSALAKHLEVAGIDFTFGWKDVSGIQRSWSVNSEQAKAIAQKVDKVSQTSSNRIRVVGRLVGASLVRDRFEIMSADAIYSGKYLRGLVEHIMDAFGKEVTAEIEETVIKDTASNLSKSYYTLTSVHVVV